MSRQLRRSLQATIKQHSIFFLLLCIVFPVMAEEGNQHLHRGDELLTLVQSEALEARVIALQENIAPGRNLQA